MLDATACALPIIFEKQSYADYLRAQTADPRSRAIGIEISLSGNILNLVFYGYLPTYFNLIVPT